MADFNCPRNAKAAVSINHANDIITERAADSWDDLLGPAVPFITTAPTFGTNAEFERIKTFLIAQAAEPFSSASGVMSRFIDEAYARTRPGEPPIRLATGRSAQPAGKIP